MSKVTLSDITNLQNDTSAQNVLNSNSAAIEAALDNTLSRDGSSPNQMLSSIDMNTNRILNLPAASTPEEPVRWQEILNLTTALGSTFPASLITGVIADSHLPFGTSIGLTFNTLALAQAATIDASIQYFNIRSVLSTEKGSPITFRRRATAGSSTNRAHMQSADGAWWEISNSILFASMFRRSGDSTNWAPAIQAMHDSCEGEQVCMLDCTSVGGVGVKIAPTTWSDRIFNISKNWTLIGMGEASKLYLDSSTSSTCDVFQVLCTTSKRAPIKLINIWIEPQNWVEALPADVYAMKTGGTLWGRDMIRIMAGATNYAQQMKVEDCYFGPTNGYTYNSLATGGDNIREVSFYRCNIWSGFKGGVGDSSRFRDNHISGFNTGFDFYQLPGASVCDMRHNNIFTQNGALRWRGGARPRFHDNNCEHIGPKTGDMTAMIDVTCDVIAPPCPEPIIRGNHFGLFKDAGGLATGMTSIARLSGCYFAGYEHNTHAAFDGTTVGMIIDNTNYYTRHYGNSYVNGNTGALLTITDNGIGTEGSPRAVTFNNSWVNNTTGITWEKAKVFRVGAVVTLTFNISSGTIASGTIAMTLPAGYWPLNTVKFAAFRTDKTVVEMLVNTDGTVNFNGGAGDIASTYGTVSYVAADQGTFGIGG